MLQNKRAPPQVIRCERREFLSIRELLYFLLSKGESCGIFHKNSPLPHPWQEESESFLEVNEKEESSISRKTDRPLQLHEKEESSLHPPVGKKRPPLFLGKGKRSRGSPLPLQKMEESTRWRKKGGAMWTSSQLSTKEVSTVQKENSSTSCSSTRRELPSYSW